MILKGGLLSREVAPFCLSPLALRAAARLEARCDACQAVVDIGLASTRRHRPPRGAAPTGKPDA